MTGRFRRSFCFVLLGTTAAAGLCSCQRSGMDLQPVSGQVFFMDQPAEGAKVVFQPASGESVDYSMPFGTVEADGTFTLHTEPHGEGAPAGEYIVLISWHGPNARENNNPRNKLPEKYNDPAMPILKATVKEGQNDLPPYRLTD